MCKLLLLLLWTLLVLAPLPRVSSAPSGSPIRRASLTHTPGTQAEDEAYSLLVDGKYPYRFFLEGGHLCLQGMRHPQAPRWWMRRSSGSTVAFLSALQDFYITRYTPTSWDLVQGDDVAWYSLDQGPEGELLARKYTEGEAEAPVYLAIQSYEHPVHFGQQPSSDLPGLPEHGLSPCHYEAVFDARYIPVEVALFLMFLDAGNMWSMLGPRSQTVAWLAPINLFPPPSPPPSSLVSAPTRAPASAPMPVPVARPIQLPPVPSHLPLPDLPKIHSSLGRRTPSRVASRLSHHSAAQSDQLSPGEEGRMGRTVPDPSHPERLDLSPAGLRKSSSYPLYILQPGSNSDQGGEDGVEVSEAVVGAGMAAHRVPSPFPSPRSPPQSSMSSVTSMALLAPKPSAPTAVQVMMASDPEEVSEPPASLAGSMDGNVEADHPVTPSPVRASQGTGCHRWLTCFRQGERQ